MKIRMLYKVASAALFVAFSSLAQAQNSGTVTSHAFAVGRGAGVTGFSSLLCTSAQLAVGQAAADPICQTITGDVTITAGGVTAIGATKVTSAMLNSDVFSTAHSWAGQQTFTAPILGTPASGTLTNATGLPVSTGISGLATGAATFLSTPSSANLRAVLTDEVGTGAAYFVGGALGTPASATLTNATGLPVGGIAAITANTAVVNATSGSASPTAFSMPSCSTASSALTWATNTGFGCNSIAGGGGGTPPLPGGRLTPSSAVCNPTADVLTATTIYYAPCNSPYVTIYNGTAVQAYTFTSSATDAVGLSLALGSNWAASTLYDVYATLNAGNPVLCTVAWTSSGAGTSARATSLATYTGFQTNATLATCRISNAATLSMAANQGTYLGTFITNGSAGQIDLKFGSDAAGGGAALASIWNAYNQNLGSFVVRDTTGATWSTTAINTFQALNITGTGSGLNNSITFVNGLQTNAMDASFGVSVTPVSGANTGAGIGLNSVTGYWSRCHHGFSGPTGAAGGNWNEVTSSCSGMTPVGLNYLQAIQVSSSNSALFNGAQLGQTEGLVARWFW